MTSVLRHGRFDVDNVPMVTGAMVMFVDMLMSAAVAIAVVVTAMAGARLVPTVIDRRRTAVLRRGRRVVRRHVV